MLSTILHYPGRILSLRLLLEDTKVLEPAARVMKTLIPDSRGESIKASMETCFQKPEIDFSSTSIERSGFDGAYRHLWLYAWKYFPEVVGNSPRRGSKCSEPPNFLNRSRTLSDFAVLARHLGFESAEISRLATSPWTTKSIERFLENFTRGGSYNTTDMQTAVGRIEPILDQFLRAIRPRQQKPPVLAQDLVAPGDGQRCGMPFENTFNEDRDSLKMEFIYAPPWEEQTSPSRYVSSFALLRDQFRCFLGASGSIPLLEAPTKPHVVASTTHNSDEDNVLITRDDWRNTSAHSDVSNENSSDAHEYLRRKRSYSAESQSPVSKTIRRK